MSTEFLKKQRHKIKRIVGEKAIEEGLIAVHIKIKNDFYITVDSIL